MSRCRGLQLLERDRAFISLCVIGRAVIFGDVYRLDGSNIVDISCDEAHLLPLAIGPHRNARAVWTIAKGTA